jgi:hypothetical protein
MNKNLIVTIANRCVTAGVIYLIIEGVADMYNDNCERMIMKASSLAKEKEIGDIVEIFVFRKFLWKNYLFAIKQYSIVDIIDGKRIVKYCGRRPMTAEEKEIYKFLS